MTKPHADPLVGMSSTEPTGRPHRAGLLVPEGRRKRVVVVGNGMVGHRFLVEMVRRGLTADVDVTVVGEELHHAYDRVALSSLFAGRDPEDLSLAEAGFHDEHAVELIRGDKVTAVDRRGRLVHTASRRTISYDYLVLATGSTPFVPPIDGGDAMGCHVYRTIDDLNGIRAEASRPGVRVGAVIGGGLLGLEAANALVHLGLETHVIEFAPRLMPLQLDEEGGAALRSRVEDLGVRLRLGAQTTRIEADPTTRRARRMHFAEGSSLDIDLLVFSAGIRPCDQLGIDMGLERGDRGGIAVDRRMVTTDPAVLAIGECAAVEGRTFGLVAPGYRMAAVAAGQIEMLIRGSASDETPLFEDGDLSTKLKLLGVDVGSIGDIHGEAPPGAERHSLIWKDTPSGIYQRIDVDDDGRVLAAVLVGDASPYGEVLARFRGEEPVDEPSQLLRPTSARADGDLVPVRSTPVCSCENVTAAAVLDAVADGCTTLAELKGCTGAGTGCGGCTPSIEQLLARGLSELGAEVSTALCDHFEMGRAELFDLVRRSGLRSFADVLERHGAPGVAGTPVLVVKCASRPSRPFSLLSAEGTYSTVIRWRCRTPTIISWRTSSATAPTRSCRESPVVRSRPNG